MSSARGGGGARHVASRPNPKERDGAGGRVGDPDGAGGTPGGWHPAPLRYDLARKPRDPPDRSGGPLRVCNKTHVTARRGLRVQAHTRQQPSGGGALRTLPQPGDDQYPSERPRSPPGARPTPPGPAGPPDLGHPPDRPPGGPPDALRSSEPGPGPRRPGRHHRSLTTGVRHPEQNSTTRGSSSTSGPDVSPGQSPHPGHHGIASNCAAVTSSGWLASRCAVISASSCRRIERLMATATSRRAPARRGG
jgi:hypothetical protein